jgi:PAS domain S-box-containing protein
MPLAELIHPDDRAVAVARAEPACDEPTPVRVEYRLRTKSGDQCWVDLTVGIIEHFGKPALLGTAFDIIERRKAEEACARRSSSGNARNSCARSRSVR